MTWRGRAAVALALLTSLPVATAAADPAAEIMARVNGTAITGKMVNDVVKSVIASQPQPPTSEAIARLNEAALESLIDLELLYQAAQAQKVAVSEQEVDAEIARNRRQFASDADFAAALSHSGLSREALRADTRKTLLVNKLLATVVWKDVQIPPDAARRFYDEHQAALSATPGAAPKSFETLRPQIERALLDEARDTRQGEYVARLRQTATIERPSAAGQTPTAAAAP